MAQVTIIYLGAQDLPNVKRYTKESYDPCKVSDAYMVKNKCIHPIYFEVGVMLPYGSSHNITPLARPCIPPLHPVHEMRVDFQCNWRSNCYLLSQTVSRSQMVSTTTAYINNFNYV